MKMRLKILNESTYYKGQLYQLKKGVNASDVSQFFNDVYDYNIREASPDVVIPWESDIRILSNGQFQLSGYMIPGRKSSARCVCTMSLDQVSELLVFDFNITEDEMDQELFDSLFEEYRSR